MVSRLDRWLGLRRKCWGSMCLLGQWLGRHVVRGRPRGFKVVVYGLVVGEGMGEGRALAGVARWCEGFGGLACGASALVLLFYREVILDLT